MCIYYTFWQHWNSSNATLFFKKLVCNIAYEAISVFVSICFCHHFPHMPFISVLLALGDFLPFFDAINITTLDETRQEVSICWKEPAISNQCYSYMMVISYKYGEIHHLSVITKKSNILIFAQN